MILKNMYVDIVVVWWHLTVDFIITTLELICMLAFAPTVKKFLLLMWMGL